MRQIRLANISISNSNNLLDSKLIHHTQWAPLGSENLSIVAGNVVSQNDSGLGTQLQHNQTTWG